MKNLHLAACIAGLVFLFSNPIFGQDPDIQNDHWDQVFRTSDQPGETPTNGFARRMHGMSKRVSAPTGAVRLGCLCMDNEPSTVRSKGACSGHGGVRYWLYKTVEGDTFRLSTSRNEVHPAPLDSAEMSVMVAKKEAKKPTNRLAEAISAMPITIMVPPMEAARDAGGQGWAIDWQRAESMAYWLMVLAALRFLLEFLTPWRDELTNALRDKLRHRR